MVSAGVIDRNTPFVFIHGINIMYDINSLQGIALAPPDNWTNKLFRTTILLEKSLKNPPPTSNCRIRPWSEWIHQIIHSEGIKEAQALL